MQEKLAIRLEKVFLNYKKLIFILYMKPAIKLKLLMPNILSTSRLFIAPLLFLFIFLEDSTLAFCCFIFSIVTDALDGYLARKYNACSTFGSYLDPIADFFIIFIALIAYSLKTIFPSWILIIIGIMFLQFLITSSCKKPVYDPIGKYYGAFLYVVIGITIIDTKNLITIFLIFGLMIFTGLSIISRIIALWSKRNLK